MSWASKPVRSECYRSFAGDENQVATTYKPGELIPIRLSVECYGMVYRGLMLYAVDSTEKKVGDWKIVEGDDAYFKTPWPSDHPTCGGTLMHSGAELKNYLSTAYFKAPAKGTGKITFRWLIKYGDANNGNFFWPEKDLELTEASDVDATIIKVGEAGKSCDVVCGSLGSNYRCDEMALKTPATFTKQVLRNTACALPLLSGCGNQAGTYDPTYQFCYYPGSDCVETNRTKITTTCSSEINGVSRFCACTMGGSSGNSGSSSSPSETTDKTDMDSSSTVRLHGISSLFALAMLFVSPRTACVLFFMIGVVTGHNWVNTQSRSRGASLYRPFKPASSDVPHYQVGVGQDFQMEWATAHGGYTYFAVVHSKYEHWMSSINTSLLEDYIKLAPASGVMDATGRYQRLHRKDATNYNLINEFTDPKKNIPDWFLGFVNQSNPLYIDRNPNLRGQIGSQKTPDNTNTYMVQYKPAHLVDDRRVSYQSTKYPYLEAVYKFKHTSDAPSHPDVAWFSIPGYAGTGRYIIQYIWSSYRDAVDVDVMSAPVTNIYGSASPQTRWKRIDHCIFDRVRSTYFFSEVIDGDASFCLKRCASFSGCFGINLVPLVAPSSARVLKNAPTGTTWFHPELYGSDIYIPWNSTAFNVSNPTIAPEVARLLANASSNRYVCYGLLPENPTDTHDEFALTKDPTDPVFFSSCLYPYKGNIFPGYPITNGTVITPSEDWRFSDKCISCESQSYNSVAGVDVPLWKVPETCVNCDLEPKIAAIPAKVPSIMVDNSSKCDGMDGVWSVPDHNQNCSKPCVIRLRPAGRGVYDAISLSECRAMVSANSDCSNQFMWLANTNRPTDPTPCYCYAKDSCCGSCSRIYDRGFSTYELKTTPDPICANGTLSADKKSCCSAECGANNCVPSNRNLKQKGFCCSTCISPDRPCSTFGAPCVL